MNPRCFRITKYSVTQIFILGVLAMSSVAYDLAHHVVPEPKPAGRASDTDHLSQRPANPRDGEVIQSSDLREVIRGQSRP